MWIKSIKWKMLYMMLMSIGLSMIVTYALFYFLNWIYSLDLFPMFNSLMRTLYYSTNQVVDLALLMMLLFVVFYLLFMNRFTKRLEKLTTAVKDIAGGNLDRRCKVSAEDELGSLEHHINMMVSQLQTSIQEERLAEQTKNELITNVSHDLRTPLTSIIGYLGLIEQDKYRDEVELRHYTCIAYEKSQRLHLMIEDLFEYTRMSGRMQLHRQQVNMTELVGQLYVHYRYPMESAALELRMENVAYPLYVLGDSLKLVRVLENLLSNAMKYGRDGGVVELQLHDRNHELEIEVTNYGEPIPLQDLPHVFDRFYRVDKSRNDEVSGSGLGLAIAKAIVELHDGRIEADSDELSTTFRVKLPQSS
ncbi:sensor histidine kinase [Paenibacillus aquistagni]|uniref:sensor histidine kinase n=1 Tax=Paenibacillus aquistagni TaxID=1852522 RepID=UPI00145A7DE4|nr:HAMP domain-containing sensor histidine kinase [Paenibacillus aquistagni]NMM54955.1 HAMP domain-containing histidine kinase [Paenibacillus aquistagni]